MLTLLSGAKQRIGPEDCPRTNWYHQLSTPREKPSEFYKYRNVLACVADIADASPEYGKLNIPKNVETEITDLKLHSLLNSPKIVILHAGASKVRKHWPNENWISLVRHLQSEGYSPVLIGAGEIDSFTNSTINSALENPIPNLVNKLGLVNLAGLLSKAMFFIGNDSGPMHLATAIGVPAIAIFGPTNDKIWGPLINTTEVMRGYQCPTECRNGHDCELAFRCLTELSAETVMKNFISRTQTLATAK